VDINNFVLLDSTEFEIWVTLTLLIWNTILLNVAFKVMTRPAILVCLELLSVVEAELSPIKQVASSKADPV